MKKYKNISVSVASVLLSMAIHGLAYADGLGGIYGGCGGIDNPGMQADKAAELKCVVQNTISIALEIVGALIVVVIIFAGIRYMTSMGNPDRVAGAKKTLVGGIIGLIIVVLSYALVDIVLGLIAAGVAAH